MRQKPWKFAAAGIDRLADVAVAACASMDDERRKIITAILRDIVGEGRLDKLLLGLAEPERQSSDELERAGVVIVLGPDDTANLLALGGRFKFETISEQQLVLRQLLDLAHKRMSEYGVTFSQAMRAPEAEEPVLAEAGYRNLATLDYMCLAVTNNSQNLGERAGADASKLLRWDGYEQYFGRMVSGAPAFLQLVQHVDETYVDSLDCPAISAFRDTEAVLRGYKGSPGYDAGRWLIASVDSGGGEISEAVGCLLLTHHPAGGSLEVTYMGVVPRWRGRGLAHQFLQRALDGARKLGVPHLTLAVDQANFPAIKLYQREGFEVLLSESVWGRKIG